jgi:RNA polymerase sigma-70 factor (ECF subfamily)
VTQRNAEDWAAVLERLRDGDRLALAQLTRLINSFLSRWGAYDLRDEWDDLVQEVLLAALRALDANELRDRAAVVGYLKSTARFKFIDRLKQQTRQHAKDHLPWVDAVEDRLEPADSDGEPELDHDLRRAVAALPEPQRQAVTAVHVRGETYDEAAATTGLPLGTLKRQLRDGLRRLRSQLEGTS